MGPPTAHGFPHTSELLTHAQGLWSTFWIWVYLVLALIVAGTTSVGGPIMVTLFTLLLVGEVLYIGLSVVKWPQRPPTE